LENLLCPSQYAIGNNFALQHLQSSNVDVRLYDASGMGPRDDLDIDSID
jgi:hypothetical protein